MSVKRSLQELMWATFAIILVLAFPLTAITQSPLAVNGTISELGWIIGDWQTTGGRAQTEEHWTPSAGGTMLGMSRTIAGDKTAEFEYLRLDQ